MTAKGKYRNLRIIGLAGGVASGKSSVADAFEKYGAAVIDADALTHRELARRETAAKIKKAFGEGVFTKGKVDRAKLADVVFSDEKKLERLNRIVHPPVKRAVAEKLAKLNDRRTPKAVVIEAALMVESGMDSVCDYVVYVACSLANRLWRAKRGRKWGRTELTRREKFQISQQAKRDAATHVINNNLTPAYMEKQVRGFFEENLGDVRMKKTKRKNK